MFRKSGKNRENTTQRNLGESELSHSQYWHYIPPSWGQCSQETKIP